MIFVLIALLAPPAPQTIQSVDWKNRDYGLITLKDGRGTLHEYAELGAPHDVHDFALTAVHYGDLDGDGQAEAVVLVKEEAWLPAGDVHYTTVRAHTFALRDGVLVERPGVSLRAPVDKSALTDGGLMFWWSVGAERCQQRYTWKAGEWVGGSATCAPAKAQKPSSP